MFHAIHLICFLESSFIYGHLCEQFSIELLTETIFSRLLTLFDRANTINCLMYNPLFKNVASGQATFSADVRTIRGAI